MKLHFRSFLPLLIALLALVGVAAWAGMADASSQDGARRLLLGFIFFLLCAVAGLGVLIDLWLRRPLVVLTRAVQGDPDRVAALPARRSGEVDALAGVLQELAVEVAGGREALIREERRRKRAERALRASRKRYGLALRGASSGGWAWNLKTGTAKFSSRWKRMLGYRDDEIADRLDEWRERIHPDDRERALREFEACIAGDSADYANEHRLKHRDGTWLWTMARGHALRSASGGVYRFLGLHTDVTERKRLEQILWLVADATSSVTGDEFFRSLVRNFAAALDVRYALITECMNYPTTRVKVLACWNGHDFFGPTDYALQGTPCDEVVNCGRLCFHPQNLTRLFPDDATLVEIGAESYLGLPIQDASGRVIGHLAFLDEKPMGDTPIAEPVFKIFTSRAAAEMVRIHAEEAARQVGVKLAVVDTQLEIAEQIQKSLLPEGPVCTARVTCAGRCVPASRVGGDYFDCLPRGDDAVDVVIADVSGHGIGSALLMVQARSVLRTEAGTNISPARLLRTLNGLLYEDLDRAETFITLFYARFDGRRGELSYASAGHSPPLLYRPGHTHCTLLDADGLILGVMKEVAFEEKRIDLKAGDVVLFYTDGLIEARNDAGEFFGTQRLAAVLARNGAHTAERIVEGILDEVRTFGAYETRSDDITLVAMQVN